MDTLISAPVLDFPPCSSVPQVEASEHILLAIFPTLQGFVRKVAPVEYAEGLARPDQPDALVTRHNGAVRRTYGVNLLSPAGGAV